MAFTRSSSYQPRHLARPTPKRHGGIAVGVVGVTAVGAVSAAATSVAAAAPTLVRYTVTPTHVRTAPSASAKSVKALPSKTKIVGTSAAGGWIRITSPASLAGKYISGRVLTAKAPIVKPAPKPAKPATKPAKPAKPATKPTPTKPAPKPVTPSVPASAMRTLYIAAVGSYSYATPSTKSARIGHLVGTSFSTTLVDATWSRVLSGPYAGRYLPNERMTTTNPSSPLAASTGTSSRAAIGVPVTRWVAGFSSAATRAMIRTDATTHSVALGAVSYGTKLNGYYISRDWFAITSGTYAGGYINAAELLNTSDFSTVNGHRSTADMCALPGTTTTTWEPTTARYLDCTAAASFLEMDRDFYDAFGYHLTLNESYRDVAKQKFFYAMWGFPRAAQPGTSNHGFGTAIDFGKPTGMSGNPFTFGDTADTWLTTLGKNYGWDRPSYLDSTGTNPEFWHYNYIG